MATTVEPSPIPEKFSNLPAEDLDTTGPDVFETADVPGALNPEKSDDEDDEFGLRSGVSNHQPVNREDLLTGSLDPSSARDRFKGQYLQGSDFSAKLTRKYPPRLPESRIYELLPRGYSSPDKGKGSDEDEREPPLARLRRLKFEMDELEDQLQNEPLEASGPQDEKADKVTPAMLLNQLKLLRSDWSRLSQPPPPIPTSSATQQGPPEASTSDQSEQTDVSDASLTGIADQVSSLEKLLGAPTSADLPPPILPTLDRLSHQLGLLSQPRHLDTLSRRIKTLVSDLERIHETRRKLGDTTPLHLALSSGLTVSTGKADDDDPTPQESGKDLPPDILPRLHALFTLLPRLQALMPLTPGLLLRLRSLAELHTSATGFNDTLKQVQDAAANVESSQTSLDTVLQNVQTSLQQNQDAMEANLGSIDQRIEALQQRITTLQT